MQAAFESLEELNQQERMQSETTEWAFSGLGNFTRRGWRGRGRELMENKCNRRRTVTRFVVNSFFVRSLPAGDSFIEASFVVWEEAKSDSSVHSLNTKQILQEKWKLLHCASQRSLDCEFSRFDDYESSTVSLIFLFPDKSVKKCSPRERNLMCV